MCENAQAVAHTHVVKKVPCHILGLRVPIHVILIQEAFLHQMRYLNLHIDSHWENVIPLMRQVVSSKENTREILKEPFKSSCV